MSFNLFVDDVNGPCSLLCAVAKDMISMGVKTVEVNMQGPGSGRDSVVRSFQGAGLHVSFLRDVTPLPHNGCRPPKKRRV